MHQGFNDEIAGPRLDGFHCGGQGSIGGDDDHFLSGVRCTVLGQEFDAADAGKDDVRDNEVVGSVFEESECGFGAVCPVHLVAVAGEHSLQGLAESIFVFNDEQSFSHCALPEDRSFVSVMQETVLLGSVVRCDLLYHFVEKMRSEETQGAGTSQNL